MKFGVRQCANIVFRAKTRQEIGTEVFQPGQPVLYIDSATTSAIEQATTTVYAQGGRGNARLIAWEGEKTVTFTFTDALLSPIGFGILSGAGIFRKGDGNTSKTEDDATDTKYQDLVHFHTSAVATLNVTTTGGVKGTIDLSSVLAAYENDDINASICVNDAPIYIMDMDDDNSVTGGIYQGTIELADDNDAVLEITGLKYLGSETKVFSKDEQITVMVDFYVDLPGKNVWQADITAETFGGNYYVEADTLFRNTNGEDLAANLTFPNVKIQSNFTMTFASTGDPSTFDFTCDAFPDYTYFDKKKKVICVLQILDYNLSRTSNDAARPVMYHDGELEHEETIWGGNTTTSKYPSNSTVAADVKPGQ